MCPASCSCQFNDGNYCKLGPPSTCNYKDDCNGKDIEVKPGRQFMDSCGRTIIAGRTCKLSQGSSCNITVPCTTSKRIGRLLEGAVFTDVGRHTRLHWRHLQLESRWSDPASVLTLADVTVRQSGPVWEATSRIRVGTSGRLWLGACADFRTDVTTRMDVTARVSRSSPEGSL